MTKPHPHRESLASECRARLHVRREGGVVWVEGAILNNRPHKHHALQIVWSPARRPARVSVNQLDLEASCAVIDGGVPHSLQMEGGIVALVDSASRVSVRLRAAFLREAPWAAPSGHRLDPDLHASAHLRRLLDDGGAEPARPMDARVRSTLDWIDHLEAQGRWRDVSLRNALALAGLSRGRFLHLFSEEVGSPWRTYLVWRRALVALSAAIEGRTLTESAYAAGYADSAHLSRQFVALFGVPPALFLRDSHFVQSE